MEIRDLEEIKNNFKDEADVKYDPSIDELIVTERSKDPLRIRILRRIECTINIKTFSDEYLDKSINYLRKILKEEIKDSIPGLKIFREFITFPIERKPFTIDLHYGINSRTIFSIESTPLAITLILNDYIFDYRKYIKLVLKRREIFKIEDIIITVPVVKMEKDYIKGTITVSPYYLEGYFRGNEIIRNFLSKYPSSLDKEKERKKGLLENFIKKFLKKK